MDLQEALEVQQISETSFRGRQCLAKPHPSVRGVFGGNLAGQALLVAIRSSPAGFLPHSFHSYFVKSGLDTKVFDWEVEKISEGKTFCNRIITGLQSGEVKYIANVSLTRKNSIRQEQIAYERSKLDGGRDNDDDDDDDGGGGGVPLVSKPFAFGTPYPNWLSKHSVHDLEVFPKHDERPLSHKLPPEMFDLDLTVKEETQPVTSRQLSVYAKWGKTESRLPNPDVFKYLGLAFLSDSLFLTKMGRILRIRLGPQRLSSVSLDHVIYFHDTDFDPTEWMGFGYRAINLSNERVLLEGEMYNKDGKHIASIIQEGLLKLGDLLEQAKL